MTTVNNGFYPKPHAKFDPNDPICWPRLDDAHALETLEELTDWVQWLTNRFTLDHRTVPHCWDQHGPIIEELSALYTAWQTAYAQTADGDAPLAWMNQFAAARHRLADWVARTGCRPGEHRARS